MAADPIKLQTVPDLVDQIHRALLNAISDGSLRPGERVTQEDLAQRFAVSRQPVLQALRLLKQDGLVLDAPGRGVLVAPLDPELIGQVYQVRGALDALAASLAAQRQALIAPQLIEQGRRAARSDDIARMIDTDIAFHSAIYAASGNPLIERSAQLHWVHLKRVMGAVLRTARQRDAIWDEHEQIARAISQGEADRAADLIQHHGRQASANLQARLCEVLETTTHQETT